MSLKLISANVGATSLDVTGGDAASLQFRTESNGVTQCILDDGSTIADTKEVVFTSKGPRVSETGANGYTQARGNIAIKTPKTLSNDVLTYNTAKIELAFDPESSREEVKDQILVICQVASNPEALDFFVRQLGWN